MHVDVFHIHVITTSLDIGRKQIWYQLTTDSCIYTDFKIKEDYGCHFSSTIKVQGPVLMC